VPTAVIDGSPGFDALGRKDFLAWVAAGHNVVFLGGYESQSAMNDLFGFQLEYVPYRPGPYWRNDRNVRGTPFEYGPSRLEEESSVYGVSTDSIPLTVSAAPTSPPQGSSNGRRIGQGRLGAAAAARADAGGARKRTHTPLGG
jgi:hypothetical protein